MPFFSLFLRYFSFEPLTISGHYRNNAQKDKRQQGVKYQHDDDGPHTLYAIFPKIIEFEVM